MGSVGGFGYDPHLRISTGGNSVRVTDCWVAYSIGSPSTRMSPNNASETYFDASDESATLLLNNTHLSSYNTPNTTYKYKIETTNYLYTFTLYDENDDEVETITLRTQSEDDGLISDAVSIACLLDYADEENPTITRVGLGCAVFGLDLNDGMPYSESNFVWFNSADALRIISDCLKAFKVGEGGKVVTRLKESDNFIITKMPSLVYGKNVVNQDHQLYNDFIPLNENFDDIALNSYYVYPHTTYTSQWSSNIYSSPFAIHTAFLDFYKDNVGSDLMRKNAGGNYTNAGDNASFNNITIKNGGEGDLFRINFSGGYAQWRYDNNAGLGISAYILDFYDDNNTLLDSWRVNGNHTSPSSNNMMSSHFGRYINVSTAFLCKEGNSYYIVGNMQCLYVYDADGNRLPASGYLGAGYVVLKKLNSTASAVLNNATETIIEYDKEDVEDTSDVGSTPQDAEDLNDNISQWSKGDLAGENDGIRHNGDDKIDASNGELTHDESVGDIHPPSESGESPVPTAITTGMIKAFAPTNEELEKFSKDLNSEDWLTAVRNFLSNPMDIVISCHTCIAPALDKGTDCYLHYGIWSSQLSTDPYSMKLLDHQYYEVDMGYINLREYRNSYKDYPPFCNYKIYLPYIGIRDIDGRICVGKQLSLKYIINVLTGDILAVLNVLNENSQNISGYYTWQGNTLSQIPLKSTDYSSMINGLISTVLSTATAGLTGNAMGLINSGVNGFRNGFHPDIKLAGTVSGGMSHCMYATPYIIREYPYLSETNPFKYGRLSGLPSNIGNKLIDNYTQNETQFIKFNGQDLNNIKTNKLGLFATESEKQELETLLAEGVYI